MTRQNLSIQALSVSRPWCAWFANSLNVLLLRHNKVGLVRPREARIAYVPTRPKQVSRNGRGLSFPAVSRNFLWDAASKNTVFHREIRTWLTSHHWCSFKTPRTNYNLNLPLKQRWVCLLLMRTAIWNWINHLFEIRGMFQWAFEQICWLLM